MGWIILVQVIKKVLLMLKKTQWTYNTLFRVSQKYIGFRNIFLKHGGVLHNPTKTYKETNTLIMVFYN
jgi:hypothetical protein